jgi:hypothetical protein
MSFLLLLSDYYILGLKKIKKKYISCMISNAIGFDGPNVIFSYIFVCASLFKMDL